MENAPMENEEKICRICFDGSGGELISPCNCSGSSKYIHRSCLDQWISSGHNPDAKKICNTCQYKYQWESCPIVGCDHDCMRKKHKEMKRCVISDVIMLLIIFIFICILLITFVYFFDPVEVIKRISGKNYIYVYFLIGFIGLFLFMTFMYSFDGAQIRTSYYQGSSDIENMIVNGTIHMYYLYSDMANDRFEYHSNNVWGNSKQIRSLS